MNDFSLSNRKVSMRRNLQRKHTSVIQPAGREAEAHGGVMRRGQGYEAEQLCDGGGAMWRRRSYNNQKVFTFNRAHQQDQVTLCTRRSAWKQTKEMTWHKPFQLSIWLLSTGKRCVCLCMRTLSADESSVLTQSVLHVSGNFVPLYSRRRKQKCAVGHL